MGNFDNKLTKQQLDTIPSVDGLYYWDELLHQWTGLPATPHLAESLLLRNCRKRVDMYWLDSSEPRVWLLAKSGCSNRLVLITGKTVINSRSESKIRIYNSDIYDIAGRLIEEKPYIKVRLREQRLEVAPVDYIGASDREWLEHAPNIYASLLHPSFC